MATETIDMKMTWASAVEVYLAVLEDGTEVGKEMARQDIRRMARIIDGVNSRYENVDGPGETIVEGDE